VKGSCSDMTSDSGLKLSTNFPSHTTTHCNALRSTNTTWTVSKFFVLFHSLAPRCYPLCCYSSALSLARTVYTLYSIHVIPQITHNVFLCLAPRSHSVFFIVVSVFLARTWRANLFLAQCRVRRSHCTVLLRNA